ncbi:MAG: deaminase, partial [Glaciihabitans sp.]|nr:deaminase [Glaciihabitans sp.]
MVVRVDLNISLDGFATTTDQSPEEPFGTDWGRLVAAYIATKTMQERVFHNTTGAGTTGVDEQYASAYFEGVGAEVMGAGMFGLHNFPDDPNWTGWWGDEPPFGYPVFVLTHTPR